MYKKSFLSVVLCSLAFFSYSQNIKNAEVIQPVHTKSYSTSLGTFSIEHYNTAEHVVLSELDYKQESFTTSDGGTATYFVNKEAMAEDTITENTITVSEKFEAHIFPNPFSDEAIITIQSSEFLFESSQIKFYDLHGKEIYLSVIRDSEQFVIHKNSLTDGMYFYQIISGKGTIVSSGKFIVSTIH